MALQFEKLTSAIESMAIEISQNRKLQQDELAQALTKLSETANERGMIGEALEFALENADTGRFHAARPLNNTEPLNQGLPPNPCPERATIVACDGSQIMPDRHAPFLYFLINVGIIVYYHGSSLAPDTLSEAILAYPFDRAEDNRSSFPFGSAAVSLKRDEAEIRFLAQSMSNLNDTSVPRLALLDQRLLYFPAGGLPSRESDEVVTNWQRHMAAIRETGGLLAGFIDRPEKKSVLGLLDTINTYQSKRPIHTIYDDPSFPHLSDRDLFEAILKVGERSAVFADISAQNNNFRQWDPLNEICFFFIKTGDRPGELARVDIPFSVAKDAEAVSMVHALIVDQCRIIGNYPYVITRADEIAVVSRQEQEELEARIARRLTNLGIETYTTAKQQSKYFARSNKTRHESY